jgi:hypothetical protein
VIGRDSRLAPTGNITLVSSSADDQDKGGTIKTTGSITDTDSALTNAKLVLTKPDATKIEHSLGTTLTIDYTFNNLSSGSGYKVELISTYDDVNGVSQVDKLLNTKTVIVNQNGVSLAPSATIGDITTIDVDDNTPTGSSTIKATLINSDPNTTIDAANTNI